MIVATAGHVDHGKSTLVRLLTGTDPDRWEEEHRRGLSIDLGFAVGRLPGGRVLSLVDVPGHRRFGANMLAGAHGADAVVFVVSAVEGWMPQSEEHLMVLQAFGARGGVIALARADQVATTELARAAAEVQRRVAGTFLEGAAVVPTDGRPGATVAALAAALDEMLDDIDEPADLGRPRLWVDRSVLVRGRGRVLTGTLRGGSIGEGDELGGSGDRRHRVRSMHVDGSPAEMAGPGRRVAVRLSGDTADIERGDALVRAGDWQRGSVLHVALRSFRDRSAPAERRGWTLVLGTGRWPVELRRPFSAGVEPDEDREVDLARLHAVDEVASVAPGDRFVLRDSGTAEAVAGGVVLAVGGRGRYPDPAAMVARHRVLGDGGGAVTLARSVLSEAGGVLDTADLRAVAGPSALESPGVVVVGSSALDSDALAQRRADLVASLDAGRPVNSPSDPLGAAAVEVSVREGEVLVADGWLHRPDRLGERLSEELRRWSAELLGLAGEAPLERAALAEAGLGNRVLADLIAAGDAVELGGGMVAPTASARRWEAEVVDRLGRGPATLGELRDLLGLSRRQTLAVCEWTDSTGITRRAGDARELAASGALGS